MKRSTFGSVLGGAAAGLAVLAIAVPAHAGTLNWSGDVDDTATISIHRHDIDIHANDHGVKHEHRDLRGGIGPGAHDLKLTARSGRGHIKITQYPNRSNDFTAIVRIHDKENGAGHYDFTLEWAGRRG